MEKFIDGETKLCCLIGDPVSHSLSPLMQNHAFRKTGINAVYLAFKVISDNLKKVVDGLKSINILGANVTIPYKTEIAKLMDKLDESAVKIGAVNTIKNDEGLLKGYNTDSEAAIDLINERIRNVEDENVLLIGAGGVARAIAYGLALKGANITILNRTISRAEELKNDLLKNFRDNLRCRVIDLKELGKGLGEFRILVNATSIGMTPNVNETPIKKEYLKGEMIVFDTVYNPLETLLLKEAKKSGCAVIEGYKMLVKQGALSFKIWTGRNPPIKEMERIVYDKLRRV